MAVGIFCEFALPDDSFLDQLSSGYERTDRYFRKREWFNPDKGRSAPPTYVFRVAKGGPVVAYCAFDFGKQPHPDDASTTKARYLVIYMNGGQAMGFYRKVGFTADPGGPSLRDEGDPILTMRKFLT